MVKRYTCEKCGCSFEKDTTAAAICTVCGARQTAAMDAKMERNQAKTLLFAMAYGGSCKKIGYANGRLFTLEALKQWYLATPRLD